MLTTGTSDSGGFGGETIVGLWRGNSLSGHDEISFSNAPLVHKHTTRTKKSYCSQTEVKSQQPSCLFLMCLVRFCSLRYPETLHCTDGLFLSQTRVYRSYSHITSTGLLLLRGGCVDVALKILMTWVCGKLLLHIQRGHSTSLTRPTCSVRTWGWTLVLTAGSLLHQMKHVKFIP